MAYSVPKLKDYSPATLDKAVDDLLSALEKESAAVRSDAEWKSFRDRWMARKNGVLTQISVLWLGRAPSGAKADVGKRFNKLKQEVQNWVEGAWADVERRLVEQSTPIASGTLDEIRVAVLE
ncbi:MAG TPA: hypothetical protein VEI73_08530, partial [Candidatus Acidoferrum sp.]|nr:hypothetical protein [Candidatus Acidoferrum sp.]